MPWVLIVKEDNDMDEHVISFNEALKKLRPDGLTLVENPQSRAAKWALFQTRNNPYTGPEPMRPAPASCDLYACPYTPGRVFISGPFRGILESEKG